MSLMTLDNYKMFWQENPHWCPVNIGPGEATWCEKMGAQRNNNGKKQGWTSKTADAENKWHAAGVAGELAVWLLYGSVARVNLIYTEDYNKLNATNDNGSHIETKSCREPDPQFWNLVVNQDQLKEEKYYVNVIVCLFPSLLFITGFELGEVIKRKARVSKNKKAGHPIYIYPRNQLQPPMKLWPVLYPGLNWNGGRP
jgi:hypothetical protein